MAEYINYPLRVKCNNFTTLHVKLNETIPDASTLAELHIVIAGCMVFLLTLPFVLYNLRCFPIGTTTATLLGAVFMVVTTVVKQEEVYKVIGEYAHFNALIVLLGMMFLAQYIEREQLLVRLLRRVLKSDHCFENYLWRVCLISALMSSVFSSGAACAILTPLVVKYWDVQERNRQELLTLLLAISTSSNIGGALTVFGNLNMVLISAKTAMPELIRSRLNMQTCLMYMTLPVMLSFLLNLSFLILHYRLSLCKIEKDKLISSEGSHSEQEMTGLTGSPKLNGFSKAENGYVNQESFERSIPCQLETILEDEILEISEIRRDSNEMIECDEGPTNEENGSDPDDEDQSQPQVLSENLSTPSLEYRPSALTLQNMQEAQRQIQAQETACLDKKLEQHGVCLLQRVGLYRSTSGISLVEFLPSSTGLQQMSHTDSLDTVFTPTESTTFQVFLCLLVSIVIALSVASTSKVPFDTGLLTLGAVTFALLFDAILNHRVCTSVLQRMDFSVLLLYAGILIWMQGLINTQVPHWIWDKLHLYHSVLSPVNLLIFCAIVIFSSSIFTAVPVTIVILDLLHPCQYQLPFVMCLAWCGTVAGNLTQFASVAGVVVAQKSQQVVKYRPTYWEYLKYGLPTTVINLLVGIWILFGLLYVTS